MSKLTSISISLQMLAYLQQQNKIFQKANLRVEKIMQLAIKNMNRTVLVSGDTKYADFLRFINLSS